jgi:hypothetical protein
MLILLTLQAFLGLDTITWTSNLLFQVAMTKRRNLIDSQILAYLDEDISEDNGGDTDVDEQYDQADRGPELFAEDPLENRSFLNSYVELQPLRINDFADIDTSDVVSKWLEISLIQFPQKSLLYRTRVFSTKLVLILL